MALTGLQIQKLLPKTNCKECGSNTCLAFAMKLAAKKASLSECPHASDEARAVLGAASEPPVRGVSFGPDKKLVLGEETVLYRHEKTFVRQPALAVNVSASRPVAEIDETLTAIKAYAIDRVGNTIKLDMVAVSQDGADDATFAALCRKAFDATGLPIVARGASASGLLATAGALKGTGSLLASATAESAEALIPAARENGLALAVSAPDLDAMLSLVESIRARDFFDLVLHFETHSLAEGFQTNSIARRAALKDGIKALGFPSIRFLGSGDLLEDTVAAATEVNKYGGIIVLPSFDPAQLAALMTLRLNVYTDPQKPIQVEPRLYPVGEPGPDAPVFVTTNFSLTYFIVSGEIENSGASAWLLVPECEGMSVLTAWAAGKFGAASIAKFVREHGVESRLTGRTIVLPGFVAQISGELEEALPGWKVLVGPQEAADLEGFIKTRLNA